MINSNKKYGFTLIELMVAVIIIAVLAAVAVPQYKKAVLKSRYSTLMPVANSLAKGNEVYYLSQGEYSKQESKLDVEGQLSVPEGTEIVLETDPEYLSYVRVSNESKVPNARYVVYQEHSKNFAGTTMCEAKDDTAKELCQSLGGVFVSENGTESKWTAYLLSGDLGVGDSFEIPCPDHSTACDDQGKATGCNSGYYIDEGVCSACPVNSTGCNENGDATSCTSGYCPKDGACVICDYIGNSSCTGSCFTMTFGGSSTCKSGAVCYGAKFSDESICLGSCNSGGGYGTTTFTDNAICGDGAICLGAVFSGNSRCTSFQSSACSSGASGERSTFKDNAVCGGTGCNTAIYQDQACCSNCSVGSGKPKCGTWNEANQVYDLW